MSLIGGYLADKKDIGSEFYFFSTGSIIVNSTSNFYFGLANTTKGAAFNIYSSDSTFIESYSDYYCKFNLFTFIDMFAGLGGAIYCYNCFTLDFSTDPRFVYNFAYQGGSIFLDYSILN